jgi:hypothetical protein
MIRDTMTPGYIPKGIKVSIQQKSLHIHVYYNNGICQCPSVEEWIKKMWYVCTMEYYSVINEMKLCWKMDGTGDHHVREISQTHKDK